MDGGPFDGDWGVEAGGGVRGGMLSIYEGHL